MRSVLIAIQPKWCDLIASGKKTAEVRKTIPKTALPFRSYIYCTKPPKGKAHMYDAFGFGNNPYDYGGKVIGEFVCTRYTFLGNVSTSEWKRLLGSTHELLKRFVRERACLTEQELLDYGGKFAWHISDLVIYDKPKELSEFRSYFTRVFAGDDGMPLPTHEIKKPPQSWCYVEECKEASK